ncbi:serine hydrolase [Cohnella caldifontis]|uniref:serine hydrolase n=1 Tax=Cohnella caldifontis TaxID=3027471 RepID=UPI0023EDF6A9|nr:serine hydrolase [Cohnella sp. YIM B05605]
MMKQRRMPFFVRAAIAFSLAAALAVLPAVRAFAAAPAPSEAGKPLTPETAAAFLDAFFVSEQAKPLYKGAAVEIVQDGRVIAQKGYGYANEAKEAVFDPSGTLFRIASVSKTFTAAAVMQLAEQGKIDLKADIRDYLPGVNFDNPYRKPVTVEDLLTHRSGFEVRDPRPEDLHDDFDRYTDMEDYVMEHMPPVVREPGTAYMYDNFAYLLLGLIVQNAGGEPFERYMDDHIFQPLGMENSAFELTKPLLDRLVTGYDAAGQPIAPYALTPTVLPQGGMLSTAEDIGKFMIAFLSGGKTATGRILTESSVEAMAAYRSTIHPLMPDTTYGFEAPIQLPEAGSSAAVLTKAGDLPGNSSLLLLIPEFRVGVFLTYNQNGALRDLFYQGFISTFFPQYATTADFGSFQPYGPEKLAPLAGLYADLRLPSIVTSVEVDREGALTISDAILGSRKLRQVDDNLFVDELTKRFTAFKLDEENGTVYLKEPYLNPLGYERHGVKPAGFADVAADDPYAAFILGLQSLGHLPNEPAAVYGPESTVTRAELARDLLEISGVRGSKSTSYAFADIQGHPLAAYIQAAYDLGMIRGDGKGRFDPDRIATRQEAAAMVWNVYRQLYPDALFADVALQGETDPWALPAVKMATALGLYGPEVARTDGGAADFRSKEPVSREEEAALLYRLLLQPVTQIVTELSRKQQAEAAQP